VTNLRTHRRISQIGILLVLLAFAIAVSAYPAVAQTKAGQGMVRQALAEACPQGKVEDCRRAREEMLSTGSGGGLLMGSTPYYSNIPPRQVYLKYLKQHGCDISWVVAMKLAINTCPCS
jgi:hypothetical protein